MRYVTAFSRFLPMLAALVLAMSPAAIPAARAGGISPEATAASYCTAKGGKVLTRVPTLNTNDAQTGWLKLSGSASFCAFTAKDGSRLELLLSTLYTAQPTLAALAYYAKEPLDEKTCTGGASPGYCYCKQLGGTDVFGSGAGGGGWVNKSEKVFTVLDACIFPDLSSIDAFALVYHSAGIVRGKNLKGVLKYPDPYTK